MSILLYTYITICKNKYLIYQLIIENDMISIKFTKNTFNYKFSIDLINIIITVTR